MNKKKDIFDKIMSLKGLNLFYPFYERHKEMLLYLFFGGLSFLVSVISYAYFYYAVEWNELIANFFSWILAVLFAYVTNKVWVFDAQVVSVYQFFRQIAVFFGGRVFTLVVEEIILYVFITRMSWNGLLIKVLAQIVVIILNYVISKQFVFKTDYKNDK